MILPEKLSQMFRKPKLTRARMAVALAVAAGTDVLQFFLGPLGWVGVDQAIDIAAFVLPAWAIGFHLLLLPTFIAEAFPRHRHVTHLDGVRHRRDRFAKTGTKRGTKGIRKTGIDSWGHFSATIEPDL